MTRTRITPADFARQPELSQHARRSKAVARALDQGAPSLPFSVRLAPGLWAFRI